MEVSGGLKSVIEAIDDSDLKTTIQSTLGNRSSPEHKEQLVLIAEKCLRHNEFAAASGFLDSFFFDSPPPGNNQCLARGYLCQAQLHAPTDSRDLNELNICTEWLLKAVEFGAATPRHHFLVFNASQLYWKLCRQFFCPNAWRHLEKSLTFVVSSLNKIDDKDYAWRATLMIELVKCNIDAGNIQEASKLTTFAFTFCQTHAPQFLPEFVHLQVEYDLTDRKALENTLPNIFLACHSRLSHLNVLRKNPDKRHLFQQKAKKLISLITEVNKTEPRKKSLRNKQALAEEEKVLLLRTLAHLCLEEGEANIAEKAVVGIPSSAKEDAAVAVDIEYLECEMIVKRLGGLQEMQTLKIIDITENAVKRCCQAIQSAIRIERTDLIQAGCVLLWNLCLPLLQPYSRGKAAKALRMIADTLETIDSLLIDLRCLAHMELAKCDYDTERLEMALDNIDKAIALDYQGTYSEYLLMRRERLVLKKQRNIIPPMLVDKAAQLVEQIATKRDKQWTRTEYQNALASAGEHLAPGVFKLTISGPNKSSRLPIEQQLKEEVDSYELAVSQTNEFLEKKSKQEAIKVCLLWADIAKVSRENSVWIVARSASRFCLQYDDGRWETTISAAPAPIANAPRLVYTSASGRRSTIGGSSQVTVSQAGPLLAVLTNQAVAVNTNVKRVARGRQQTAVAADDVSEFMARHLLRRLVEAHFTYAESLIELLMRNGLNLCDKPDISTIFSKKTSISTCNAEWQQYCDWTSSLTAEAVSHFHRAAQIGCLLKEKWILYQTLGYVFNYTNHAVKKGRLASLVSLYKPLIDMYMSLQDNGELELLCQMVTVVAGGLMAPNDDSKSDSVGKSVYSQPPAKKGPDVRVGVESPQVKTTKKQQLASNMAAKDEPTSGQRETENLKDLKAAVELCEQANGKCASQVVSMKVRKELLQVWVQLKHLLQQAMNKPHYGQDNPNDSLTNHCKAIVAVEMLSCRDKPPGSFSSCPLLSEAIAMVECCEWIDPLIEMEMWSRLAMIAAQSRDEEKGLLCADNSLKFSQYDVKDGTGSNESRSREIVQNELVSIAYRAKGMLQMLRAGDTTSKRQLALSEFVCSAKHACKSENYNLVIEATRHAWNLCCNARTQTVDRELLKEPLEQLLRYVAEVTGRDRGRDAEEGDLQLPKMGTPEDLKVRVELYIIIFRSYADKCEWDSGLKSVDEAIWYMPKSTHRTLVEYRMLFKNKLGKSVTGDIQRLAIEDEEFLVSLWHRVARNSNNPLEQFSSFTAAIQTASTKWQKIDLLMELANWMHLKEWPRENTIKILDSTVGQLYFDEGVSDLPKILATPEPTAVKQSGGSKAVIANKATTREKSTSVIRSEENDDVSLAWRDKVTGYRRLETLLRCYVMMAQEVGRSSKEYLHYLTKATGCCHDIWKLQGNVLSSSTSQGEKERPEDKKGKETRLGKTTSNSKRKEKCIPVQTITPDNLAQWATFELTDEVRECLRNDTTGNAVNKLTVCKLGRIVEVLTVLVSELADNGLQSFCFPALALHHLIALDVACNVNMVDLLHLKFIDCCQSLGLSDGVEYHEQFVTKFEFRRMDQLFVLSQIEKNEDQRNLLKAEENQQALEKRRIQGMRDVAEMDNSKGDVVIGSKSALSAENRSKLELVEIWIDQAELQLKQGDFKSAADRLEFCRTAAMGFKADWLWRRILYNEGCMSLFQCETSETIRFLSDAQKFYGDLKSWMDILLKLSAAYHADRDENSQAVGILTHAITLFGELAEERPYLSNECRYIQAVLQSQCAMYKMKDISNTSRWRQSRKRTEMKHALELYEKSSDQLLQLHYTQRAIEVMLNHSRDLRIFAEGTSDIEQRHEKLLEVNSILQNAFLRANSLFTETLALVGSHQLNGCWLLVHHLLVEVGCEYTDLLLLVLAEEGSRRAEERHAEGGKSREEKMLDSYRMSPVLTDTQEKWKRLTEHCVGIAFSTIMSSYHKTQSIQYMKDKVTLQLGQLLCWMADIASTTYNCWSCRHIEAKETSVETEVFVDRETSEELSDREQSETTESANKDTFVLPKTPWQFAQGAEILALAVQDALNKEAIHSAAAGSLDLVECFGMWDQLQSVQYLSLYQSCRASEYLQSLIRIAQNNANVSLLAYLFHQRHHLQQSRTLGPLRESNKRHLEKFETYRRMQVGTNHFDLFSAMPASFCFVMLQHSPDRRCLYGSIVMPNQVKSTDGDLPSIARAAVDPARLKRLLGDFELYKRDREQHLLQCDFLFESQVQSQGSDTKSSAVEIAMKNGELLEVRFAEFVLSLNAYFEPLISQLPKPSTLEDVSAVVLLLDEWLLRLPVECISWLSVPSTVAVTRDVSLQVFYYRLRDTIEEDLPQEPAVLNAKKSKAGVTPRPDKSKDGDRKKEKVSSVPPPKVAPSSISVDMSKVKYILDPYADTDIQSDNQMGVLSPQNEENVVSQVQSTIKSLGQLSVKWSGQLGRDLIPSYQQWRDALATCSSFIMFGAEKLLGYYPPQRISALDLSGCRVAVLADKAHTSASFLKQSKLDADKYEDSLSLEGSVETALLLSLSGVGSVFINQYSSTPKDNCQFLCDWLQGMATEGKTVGEALNSWREPNSLDQTHPSETATEEEANPEGTTQLKKSFSQNNQQNINSKTYNIVLYGLPQVVFKPSS